MQVEHVNVKSDTTYLVCRAKGINDARQHNNVLVPRLQLTLVLHATGRGNEQKYHSVSHHFLTTISSCSSNTRGEERIESFARGMCDCGRNLFSKCTF